MKTTTFRITKNTLAILPHYDINHQSSVIEYHHERLVKETPLALIKANCLVGGSTYKGRKQAVNYHLEFQQKVPIPLSPIQGLYTFPTQAPTSRECIWLFFHAIQTIYATTDGTQVMLINGKSLQLDLSYNTIKNQYDRTGMCKVVFDQMRD